MELQAKQPTVEGRYEARPPRGVRKPVCSTLIASSADRAWSGLSADLCAAEKGEIPWRTPQSNIRICTVVRSNKTIVTRQAPGIESHIVAEPGTVWLSPPGLQEGSLDFTHSIPELLHIHLPLSHFSSSGFDNDTGNSAIDALRYETPCEDPLLTEIGYAVASELKNETSAGGMLVESLSSSLAARLLQKQAGALRTQPLPCRTHQGLDQRRLSRVLDYIDANLEGDLSLECMATIACLSKYHFARAFRQAVGDSPHRYVSARRLERAKALLIRGDRPLVDIALSLNFSSQANFTRAFKQATGHAPGRYRQAAGYIHASSL